MFFAKPAITAQNTFMVITLINITAILNMKITPNAFNRAVGLGIIAGMRTFMAPAVVSHMYSRHSSKSLKQSPLNFFQTITASKVFKVLAAGELVADKLPGAPNRTALPGLVGRTLAGIVCGATVYKASNKKPYIGAIVGGTAAVASTFACFYLRTAIAKNKFVPDAVIGGIEDVLAIAGGVAITSDR